ncbi:MAG: NAD(P)/FAD-dependent oxidoreductase [Myxococcota bacterium]|nr:NAD(P)/FAD-dependent oxidoreductase [Deltaproteobacteria bacterium]MDQ3338597.1 NAD(P)/FAD-dependent oxidoreductase [Myxococcota bacterium]
MRDVVIVGGGPAGLAAALVFGRSRKRVTLFDAGEARNAASEHVHGFLSRDGVKPSELRAIARAELARYSGVEVRDARVLSIEKREPFVVHTDREKVEARRVLLCVGLLDELPQLAGMTACWGKSVLHCPYCHGWECREKHLGFLPRTETELDFALLLRGWTDRLTVFSNGVKLDAEMKADFETAKIRVDERRVVGLRSEGCDLRAVQVEGGEVAIDNLFVHPVQRQTPVVAALGLRMLDENSVWVDEHGETSAPGIYAAGDLTTPIHGALLAAAAGAAAAYKLNTALTKSSMREKR